MAQKSYEQGNVEAQFLLSFSYFMQVDRKEECFKLMKPIAEKDPSEIKKVYGIAEKDGSKPYSSPEEMVALAQLVIASLYADGAGTEKILNRLNIGLKNRLNMALILLKKKLKELSKKYALKKLKNPRFQPQIHSQSHCSQNQYKV